MAFPQSMQLMQFFNDLTEINDNITQMSVELNSLYPVLLSLCDKELQMFAIASIDTAMTDNQNVLKLKVNSILDVWK